MITHLVGMHENVFGNNEESLENKVTFINTKYTHSMGPDGNGHKFTWILLNCSSTTIGICYCVFLEVGGNP